VQGLDSKPLALLPDSVIARLLTDRPRHSASARTLVPRRISIRWATGPARSRDNDSPRGPVVEVAYGWPSTHGAQVGTPHSPGLPLAGSCYLLANLSPTRGNSSIAGRFEVSKDKSGEFRFRLKAANGEPTAASEGYKTKASALSGIESVKKNAPDAAIDDQTY
jgi:uncharacterized protein YegP (UPF0339 family)